MPEFLVSVEIVVEANDQGAALDIALAVINTDVVDCVGARVIKDEDE